MLTLVRRPSATRPTAAVAAVAVAAVAVAKDVILFLCNRLSQDDAAKVQTVTTERVSSNMFMVTKGFPQLILYKRNSSSSSSVEW